MEGRIDAPSHPCGKFLASPLTAVPWSCGQGSYKISLLPYKFLQNNLPKISQKFSSFPKIFNPQKCPSQNFFPIKYPPEIYPVNILPLKTLKLYIFPSANSSIYPQKYLNNFFQNEKFPPRFSSFPKIIFYPIKLPQNSPFFHIIFNFSHCLDFIWGNFLKVKISSKNLYPTIFSPPKCFSSPKYLTPQNLPFS